MIVKLLTEHCLEFLSLKGGCTCSSESTHVKMPHCWKSHALAQCKLGKGVNETCSGSGLVYRKYEHRVYLIQVIKSLLHSDSLCQ